MRKKPVVWLSSGVMLRMGFPAPIPWWGRVRFRVTQSPGTARAEELLTHTGTRGAAAAQSAGVLLLTSSPAAPLGVLSHSPAARGAPW